MIFIQEKRFNIENFDKNSYLRKIVEESSLKMNRFGDEPGIDDMVSYNENSKIILDSSKFTTKAILSILDELEIKEEELRESPDFHTIVSHLNVNERDYFQDI